tara:strand:- start:192 stop:803 length:612 start_codon:yes stop_codon:yes gene_type:complete
MTKCPKNKFCIDNYIIYFLIICLFFSILFIYNNYNTFSNNNYKKVKFNENNNQYLYYNKYYDNVNENNKVDVLLNPYSPPLRDDRINNQNFNNVNNIPINIPTQSVDTNYRQIGLLTRVNGPETILPLMGRPLFTNRDKWNFYTMNDKNNMIKLPITFKNKSCTSEQGCDNLYDGDTVYVEGYSDIFRVTMYDNNTLRYIPSL